MTSRNTNRKARRIEPEFHFFYDTLRCKFDPAFEAYRDAIIRAGTEPMDPEQVANCLISKLTPEQAARIIAIENEEDR